MNELRKTWYIYEGKKHLDTVPNATKEEAWTEARRMSDRPKRLKVRDTKLVVYHDPIDDEFNISEFAPFLLDIPDEIKEAI